MIPYVTHNRSAAGRGTWRNSINKIKQLSETQRGEAPELTATHSILSGRGSSYSSGTHFKRHESQPGPGVLVCHTHVSLPLVSVLVPVSVYTASIPFLCSLRGRKPSPPPLHHVSIRWGGVHRSPRSTSSGGGPRVRSYVYRSTRYYGSCGGARWRARTPRTGSRELMEHRWFTRARRLECR
ncbi:unnamed protein product [Danaus chrysippus]|uniref:(African queen) hypothetical protein n=1 Tax=Danaus chrysippus TaxID=151541 RepID=A0A8J2QL29_9NEOP|nr:unnamed protein product [Danaus chrysippus]